VVVPESDDRGDLRDLVAAVALAGDEEVTALGTQGTS
jgi:hypothetical protein